MAVRELATGQFRGAGGRFIPNPVGIKLIASGPGVVAMLQSETERIAEIARSIAPVLSGAYRNSIRASTGFDRESAAVVGRVNAFDFKAAWIEFGTGHPGPTQAFHVLSRAAESAGYALTAASNLRRAFGTGLERVVRLA